MKFIVKKAYSNIYLLDKQGSYKGTFVETIDTGIYNAEYECNRTFNLSKLLGTIGDDPNLSDWTFDSKQGLLTNSRFAKRQRFDYVDITNDEFEELLASGNLYRDEFCIEIDIVEPRKFNEADAELFGIDIV